MRQLEFDLPSTSIIFRDVEAWKYKFTRTGLVEDRCDTKFVYGLWDKLFGCWRIDAKTGRSREHVPRWQLFNENGVWRDHVEVRYSESTAFFHAELRKWRYEANAAFAGYLSGIPHRIRSVVAPFKSYQWLALDLVWQQPDFAQFLDEEIYNGTQQYVFACFSLGQAADLSRSARHQFVNALLKTRRTVFLERLAGMPCSRAALRVINKLGAEPLSPDLYRSVITCMNDEKTAKALSHAGDIDPETIGVMTDLPDDFRLPNVVRILLDKPASNKAAALRHTNERVCSDLLSLHALFTVVSKDWRTRVLDALHAVNDLETLQSWMAKWRERLLPETRPFPAPPFPARGQLIPLADVNSIRAEARTMRSCLESLILDVLEGHVYFYRWQGREPATIMLKKHSSGDWRFAEALGENNVPLEAQTDTYIEKIVSQSIDEKRCRPG